MYPNCFQLIIKKFAQRIISCTVLKKSICGKSETKLLASNNNRIHGNKIALSMSA